MNSPFIIAEIGSNWKSFEDCLYSILVAKQSGADAVKFQLFTHESLYGFDGEMRSEPNPYLPIPWLSQLKAQADQVGIEFMCSSFSPELAGIVNPFVLRHKVASSEMYHIRLLDKLNALGKPVILSTAASTLPDINAALTRLPDVKVTVCYCVGGYPAKEIDLRVISELSKMTGKEIGYSDHSLDVREIPLAAIRAGASLIEKHVNFTDHTDTPDADHALNQREFTLMVKALRGEDSEPYIGPIPEERDMIMKHKRRLKATKRIAPGEVLQEGVNMGVYRSKVDDAHAYSPFFIDNINGRKAVKEIEAFSGIGPEDFE